MYVSISKKLIGFQSWYTLCLGFARNGVKRHFSFHTSARST